jgi:glyoxylase-like metal-dependent hydrolase (beta-lactamase superfamily II)
LEGKEWKGRQGTLVWFWKESGQKEGSPWVICLVSSEEEAGDCADLLGPQLEDAAICCAVVPGGDMASWEEDVADLVYQLRQDPALDQARSTLTGTASCADGVWQLASHFPQWFAGVCVVGGYADPYQARALKDVPLLVWTPVQEDTQLRNGTVVSSAEVTVSGLRAVGAGYVETPHQWEELSPQQVWEKAFSQEGGSARWLLSQDRRGQFMVDWVKPGVWCINDFFSSCCYLVEGQEKALLIDTGMGEGDLPALVASLTTLPVEVAVTHPHLDHMHWIDQFSKVYLHEKDIALLREDRTKYPAAFKDKDAPLPELLPIEGGSKIDLGGGVVIETLDLPGHTPHSVVFADEFHQCLFTGDAIGSGDIALMICREEEAMDLVAKYREALEAFLPNLPRLRDYTWLGGHVIQENGGDPRQQQSHLQGRSQYFNPIRPKVVKDMIALCDGLLSGQITWTLEPIFMQYHCEYGCAGINFRFL